MSVATVNLGDYVKIRTGKLDANAAVKGGEFPFFTCAKDISWIDTPAFDANAVLVAGNGDLNVKHYIGKFNAYQRTYVIENGAPDKLDMRYLFHFMDRYVETLRRQSIGGVIKYIKLGNLTDAPFPIKPLEEQRRIAAILDKADAIRRKRQQALTLADNLRDSIFSTMFGSSDAEPKTIQRLLDEGVILLHKDGNHGSNYPRSSEFGSSGVPFITAKAISNSQEIEANEIQFLGQNKADKLKIGRLEANDVLLAHNATVGPVALYDGRYEEAIIGTSLTAFRPDQSRLMARFLLAALRHSSFQRQLMSSMSQTTRNQVPITAQRAFNIPVPNLKEQREFCEVSERLERSVSLQRQQLEETEVLLASLSQRAFQGEL